MKQIVKPKQFLLFFSLFFLSAIGCKSPKQAQQPVSATDQQWSTEKAAEWRAQKGWLVGCNFNPSNSINQLEMWQAETFDTAQINKELGWAEWLGFNSVRVFLHNLLWEQDSTGFKQRLDQYLTIADRHGIGTMFVLFDACWNPNPHLGKQPDPKPHVHNSGWVQSPGDQILKDTNRYDGLKGYVQGVVGFLRNDKRVHAWDLFNEPDNGNNSSYADFDGKDKGYHSLILLRKTFSWARAMHPTQPLTAAPWQGDWSDTSKLSAIDRFMFTESDIITFHCYDEKEKMEKKIQSLQKFNRPLLCTEYMARPNGSTFRDILPLLRKYGVAAYNWGFVAGKTNTIYPWDSWKKTYTAEPPVWFHDIFRPNGSPFDPAEPVIIRGETGKSKM